MLECSLANSSSSRSPSGAGSVGMNIGYGTNLTPGSVSQVITSLFYNGEINNFPAYGVNDLNTSDPSFENWGHFSQVVWKSTTQVACYTTNCANSGIGWFTACLYSPPGMLFAFLFLSIPSLSKITLIMLLLTPPFPSRHQATTKTSSHKSANR